MKKILNVINSKGFKIVVGILIVIYIVFTYIDKKHTVEQKKRDEVLMYGSEDSNKNVSEEASDFQQTAKKPDSVTRIREMVDDRYYTKKPEPWVDADREKFNKMLKKNKLDAKLRKVEGLRRDIDTLSVSREKTMEVLTKKITNYILLNKLINDDYLARKKQGKLPIGKKIKSEDYIYITLDGRTNDPDINNYLKANKMVGQNNNFMVLKTSSASEYGFYSKMVGKKIGDKLELTIYDFMTEQMIEDYKIARLDAKEAIEILMKQNPALAQSKLKDFDKINDIKYTVDILDIFDKSTINKFNLTGIIN